MSMINKITSRPANQSYRDNYDLAMQKESTDTFDTAMFYTCTDGEHLDDTMPEEAIKYYFDGFFSKDCDWKSIVQSKCPVTVTAYNRAQVTENWIEDLAVILTDKLVEAFNEDYGDPDGGNDGLTRTITRAAEQDPRLLTWIKSVVDKGTVWHCEEVASREYTAEEVVAIIGDSLDEQNET